MLYFKVLAEHLPELLPVVYDPTVGAAIEQYSDEYRGQRGVYLSIDRPDDGYVDYSALLHGHLDSDPRRVSAVAVALVAALVEERARQFPTSPAVARYLDAIERFGYQPTDWEHAQRLTATAA